MMREARQDYKRSALLVDNAYIPDLPIRLLWGCRNIVVRHSTVSNVGLSQKNHPTTVLSAIPESGRKCWHPQDRIRNLCPVKCEPELECEPEPSSLAWRLDENEEQNLQTSCSLTLLYHRYLPKSCTNIDDNISTLSFYIPTTLLQW